MLNYLHNFIRLFSHSDAELEFELSVLKENVHVSIEISRTSLFICQMLYFDTQLTCISFQLGYSNATQILSVVKCSFRLLLRK